MKLKPNTEAFLEAWLGAPTWHTTDDDDINRWYSFVDQYQKDHGFAIDEVSLREVIERKLGGNIGEDSRKIIRDRIGLAYNILDFLKHTGR